MSGQDGHCWEGFGLCRSSSVRKVQDEAKPFHAVLVSLQSFSVGSSVRVTNWQVLGATD